MEITQTQMHISSKSCYKKYRQKVKTKYDKNQMDNMPYLWRENKGKDKRDYYNERFSIVLSSL